MGWVAAAIGIGQAVVGIFGAKKQKDVDKASTELTYRDNLEKIRRRAFQQEQIKGVGKAFTEASGVLHTKGSSAQGYLDTLSREFRLELDWMRRFANEARKLGHKGASVRHSTNVLGAIAGGISTGASIYSMGGGGGFSTEGPGGGSGTFGGESGGSKQGPGGGPNF